MVPGLSERDAGAAELRRRDLLADAARERRAGASGPGGLPAGVALRRRVGVALVRAGTWLQGAPLLAPVGGGPAALGVVDGAPAR